jgi:tetratricopeptide (TPR) repeat protein
MAASLWYFWFADGALVEGRRWLEGFARPDGTGQPHDGSEVAQATAVAAAGWLANVQNETDHALALAERSLSLPGAADLEVTALAWATQGSAAINKGNFEEATAVFKQSLEVARRARSTWWTATFLNNLGFAAYLSGDLDKGRVLIEESVDLRRRTGDLRGLASSLLNLGSIAFADGDVPRAHLLYLQSLKLVVSVGGATPVATDLLEDLSGVLLARGQSSLAVRTLAAVDAFRKAICVPEPGWRQSNLEGTVRRLTQVVDPETYASLWAEGRKLRIEQAMSEVLASSEPGGPGDPARVNRPSPRSECSGPQRPPGRWKASRPRTTPSHRVPAPVAH